MAYFSTTTHHLCFYHFQSNVCHFCRVKRTKINKKEAWLVPKLSDQTFCPRLLECLRDGQIRTNVLTFLIQISQQGFFKKNGPCTASYSFIFGLFKQIIQFLQLINVKKFPFSIWRWYSNPHPLAHELSPITTTPGLPPFKKAF